MSFELTAFITSFIISKLLKGGGEIPPENVAVVSVDKIRGRALTKSEIESVIRNVVNRVGVALSEAEAEKLIDKIYEWQSYLMERKKIYRRIAQLEKAYSEGRIGEEVYLYLLLRYEKKLEESIVKCMVEVDDF